MRIFKFTAFINLIVSFSTCLEGSNKAISEEVYMALEHPSSDIFTNLDTSKEPENDLYSKYLKKLRGFFYTNSSSSEKYSLLHQLDLLNIFSLEQERRLRKLYNFNSMAYKIGVLQSDLGKLQEYKTLLTIKSAKSDLLINVISGKWSHLRSSQLIKEILAGKSLLNPSLSADEVRALFTAVPPLQGFFHELPGIADGILALEHGIISESLFKESLKANLFHNGPRSGFWLILAQEIVPGMVKNKNLEGSFSALFEDTPFALDSNKALTYPNSLSFEGKLHNIYDRISQGTKGGIKKIFHELYDFSLRKKIEELRGPALEGTIKQLKNIKGTVENGELTLDKKKILIKEIDGGISYIVRLMNFLQSEISYMPERNFYVIPGELSFSEGGVKGGSYQVFYLGSHDELATDAFFNLLDQYEELQGNPMTLQF